MSKKVNSVILKEDKAVIESNETTSIKNDLDEIKKELSEIKTLVKDFKKNLKGLVEIQQRLVHERLGAPVPIPPKEYGEETNSKSAGIELSSTADDRIKISGKKSFDIKETIKESAPSKAKFNASDKSWSIPAEYLDDLITNLEAINLIRDKDFIVNITGQSSKKVGGNVIKKQEEEEEDGIDSNVEESGFGSGFN
jgi:hypothetical protein